MPAGEQPKNLSFNGVKWGELRSFNGVIRGVSFSFNGLFGVPEILLTVVLVIFFLFNGVFRGVFFFAAGFAPFYTVVLWFRPGLHRTFVSVCPGLHRSFHPNAPI